MINATYFWISNVVQLDFKYNDKMQNKNEIKWNTYVVNRAREQKREETEAVDTNG